MANDAAFSQTLHMTLAAYAATDSRSLVSTRKDAARRYERLNRHALTVALAVGEPAASASRSRATRAATLRARSRQSSRARGSFGRSVARRSHRRVADVDRGETRWESRFQSPLALAYTIRTPR